MSAGLPVLDLPPSSNGIMGNASVHKMPSSSTMGIGDSDEDLTFDSPEEEIAHYRDKYRQAIEMLTDTRAELEEFQQSSKELEDEMEQELASNDKQQADLRDKIKRLEVEKEEWRSKHISLQKMHSSTTAAMQREMDNLRSERDKTLVALRDLEMGNDELERNERVAVSSLLDLESKYNRAIEEKTLLEQDLAQRDELEAECQRLKDEMRDANNEISILKDQLSRAISTPPSSISAASASAPMSPVHEASRELSVSQTGANDALPSPTPPPVPSKTPEPSSPSTKRGLTRSGTMSSIPVASPSAKRFSIAPSPSQASGLSRSTTSRNLANAAGPASPMLARSRSGIPQASPARLAILERQQTKSRGFKLLHDLQARLKATDDKLGGAKVPRRQVSGGGGPTTGFTGMARRVTSTASNISGRSTATERSVSGAVPHVPRAPHARVTALAKDQNATPVPPAGRDPPAGGGAGNPMSPGWVLVGDGEGEDTPTGPWSMTLPAEPDSPLDPTFRAVSSASTSSNRSLPARPGIPSPLASGLTRSTISSAARQQPRPSFRMATSTRAANSATYHRKEEQDRPMSPSMIPLPASANSLRPMSPSMIPTSTRPMSPGLYQSYRAPSPGFAAFPASSQPPSQPASRPSSRTEKRPIGRGPPPVSGRHHVKPSLNTSTGPGGLPQPPTGAEKVERAKRAPRRSSLGAQEAFLPPTGIPAPRTPGEGGAGGGKGRPQSVHVFGSTPPPVPRIPSAMLRESSRKR
ncbi:hypothetical protein IAT38_006801 [Cryptococcus sp. DSM 104549]